MIASEPLGSVLFERSPAWRELRVMLIFAGVAFCLCIVVGVNGYLELKNPNPNRKPDEPDGAQILAMSGAMFCASLLLLGGCWFASRSVVLRHERGIVRSSPWRRSEFPFAALASFSFRRQPELKQGVPVAMSYFMQFDPAAGCGCRTLIWHVKHVPLQDQPQFEAIQEQLSDIVAAKMAEELNASGRIAWTPQMWLRADGIEYQGLTSWRMLTWAEMGRPSLNSEKFELFGSRGGPPLFELNPAQPNFYPGLLLAAAYYNDFHAQPRVK